MTNSVECPKCAQSFQVPSELMGKRMRCLKCQQVFVPKPVEREETALQTSPSPRRPERSERDEAPPPPRSEARIKREDEDKSGYLWPLAVLPWGLLLLAFGGCLVGLLAGVTATVLSGVGIVFARSRQMSFGVRLGGLLAINGLALLLFLCGGLFTIYQATNAGSNRTNPNGFGLFSQPFQKQPPPQLRPAPEVKLPPIKPIFDRGPRVYLADMDEFGVLSGFWPFEKSGKVGDGSPISLNGQPSPKGLSMHPPQAPAFTTVRYRLGKQAAMFRAVVAINDTTKWCWSPATFSVIGDGKILWQSVWIAHNHAHSQECSVSVEDVDVLELRVYCENGNKGLHAVWIEPRLLQKADAPDR